MFTHLLRLGVLDDIVRRYREDRDARDESLLSLFSFIFERCPLAPTTVQRARAAKAVGGSAFRFSHVLHSREAVHPTAVRHMQDFNRRTLELFQETLLAYVLARGDSMPFAAQLPASGVQYGAQASPDATADGALYAALEDASAAPDLRSPFLALTGDGDSFDSAGDVVRSVRFGVRMHSSQVPQFDVDVPLNRIVLDFYEHGMAVPLQSENGFAEGEAWELLKRFSTLLTTLATALAAADPEADTTKALMALAMRYNAKFGGYKRAYS